MTTRKTEPTIYDVIAGHVRRLRTDKGLTQEELALNMSERGFSWSRVTVAEVEGTQGRRVALDEWLGLALVFSMPATSLLIPDDTLSLSDSIGGLDTQLIRLLLHEGMLDTRVEERKLAARRYQIEGEIQILKRQQVEASKALEEREEQLFDCIRALACAQEAGDNEGRPARKRLRELREANAKESKPK